MSCPYGTVGQIYDYGVNADVVQKYDCMENTLNAACKPNASWIEPGLTAALGLESHLFIFEGRHLYDTPVDHSCTDKDATLFVQYSCVQNYDEQAVKYEQISLAVATAVLIAFLFTVSIRYMYQGGKIVQLEWDMATVTAGDFAVEFPIKKQGYLDWKEHVYRAAGGPFENGEAPALALKKFMKHEI